MRKWESEEYLEEVESLRLDVKTSSEGYSVYSKTVLFYHNITTSVYNIIMKVPGRNTSEDSSRGAAQTI